MRMRCRGIVFLMRSVEHLVVYGKRVMGHRAGLAVHDRAPSTPVHPFGLAAAERYAATLGRYGEAVDLEAQQRPA